MRSRHTLVRTTLCLSAAMFAAVGCAGGGGANMGRLGAGQWQVHLPTTRSPIQELTHDKSSGSSTAPKLTAPAATSGDEGPLSDVEMPALPRSAANESRPKIKTKPAAQPAPASNTPEAPAPAAPEASLNPLPPAPAPAEPAPDTASLNYGEREQRASAQQQFRGGDIVILSVGAIALAIILLSVILVLLARDGEY